MEMTKEQALNEFKRQVSLNQSIGYDEMLSILKEHFGVETNNSEAMKVEDIKRAFKGESVLLELLQNGQFKNKDGMRVIEHLDKLDGGSIAYIRHDALVSKLNSIIDLLPNQ